TSNGRQGKKEVSLHQSSTFPVLSSVHFNIDVAHDPGPAHSLAHGSLGATRTLSSGVCCWNALFRQERMEEFAKWHTKHECADHPRCNSRIRVQPCGSFAWSRAGLSFLRNNSNHSHPRIPGKLS